MLEPGFGVLQALSTRATTPETTRKSVRRGWKRFHVFECRFAGCTSTGACCTAVCDRGGVSTRVQRWANTWLVSLATGHSLRRCRGDTHVVTENVLRLLKSFSVRETGRIVIECSENTEQPANPCICESVLAFRNWSPHPSVRYPSSRALAVVGQAQLSWWNLPIQVPGSGRHSGGL
jgi:hypothetical protein